MINRNDREALDQLLISIIKSIELHEEAQVLALLKTKGLQGKDLGAFVSVNGYKTSCVYAASKSPNLTILNAILQKSQPHADAFMTQQNLHFQSHLALHYIDISKLTVERIELLAKHGIELTMPDTDNCNNTTLLHKACSESAEPELISALIKHGLNVNAPTKSRDLVGDIISKPKYKTGGDTPLHLALAKSNPEPQVVATLLRHGADLDAVNHTGKTPYQNYIALPKARSNEKIINLHLLNVFQTHNAILLAKVFTALPVKGLALIVIDYANAVPEMGKMYTQYTEIDSIEQHCAILGDMVPESKEVSFNTNLRRAMARIGQFEELKSLQAWYQQRPRTHQDRPTMLFLPEQVLDKRDAYILLIVVNSQDANTIKRLQTIPSSSFLKYLKDSGLDQILQEIFAHRLLLESMLEMNTKLPSYPLAKPVGRP